MSYKSAVRKSVLGVVVAAAFLAAVAGVAPYTVNGSFIRDQLFARMASWSGGQVTAHGAVYLVSLFNMTVEAEDVEILAPARFSHLEKVRVRKFSGRLSWWELLQGRFAIEKIWLIDPRFTLAEGAVGEVVRDDGLSIIQLAMNKIEESPFPEIVMYGGEITGFGEDAQLIRDLGTFDGRFELADDKAILRSSGKFVWRGQEVSYRLRRGRFSGGDNARSAPFRLSASGAFGDIGIRGRITSADRSEFSGRFDVNIVDSKATAQWLRLDTPWSREGTYLTANGNLDWSGKTAALEGLTFEWGNFLASGVLTVDYESDRPRISGTLDLGDLSFTPFLSEADGQQGADGERYDLRRLLNLADADLRLSATSVSAGQLSAGAAALFVSVKSGQVKGDIAELMIFGGTVRGQFDLSADEADLKLNLKCLAQGVHIDRMLSVVSLYPWLSGRADITVRASGMGRTSADVLRSLKASGHIVAVDGGQMGQDVLALLSQAQTSEAQADGSARFRSSGVTQGDFDTLNANFSISQEQLMVTALRMTKDEWAILGKGTTDLRSRTLDWSFRFKQFSGADEAGAKTAFGLSETHLAEPLATLHINGPWTRPEIRYTPPPPTSRAARKG